MDIVIRGYSRHSPIGAIRVGSWMTCGDIQRLVEVRIGSNPLANFS